jgi:hypothetical protein
MCICQGYKHAIDVSRHGAIASAVPPQCPRKEHFVHQCGLKQVKSNIVFHALHPALPFTPCVQPTRNAKGRRPAAKEMASNFFFALQQSVSSGMINLKHEK